MKSALTAALASLVLALGACRSGPYHDPPRYLMPETRSTAARHVNEALVSSGIGFSEVAADEVRVTWNEIRRLSDKRQMLIEREMIFNQIHNVNRPARPGEWWQVKVFATGGAITFTFRDDADAAKFESAVRRLRQTITPGERTAIARKYLAYVEGRHRKSERRSPAPTAAGETLRALTGRNFGTDAARWRAYLEDNYGS